MPAFIKSVSKVAQSKSVMLVRITERIAHGVQQISDFLPAGSIESAKLIDEIRIEMSLKARLRYCR